MNPFWFIFVSLKPPSLVFTLICVGENKCTKEMSVFLVLFWGDFWEQKLNGESLKKKHEFQMTMFHIWSWSCRIVWKSCSLFCSCWNCEDISSESELFIRWNISRDELSQWNVGLLPLSIPGRIWRETPHIKVYIYIYIYSHLFKAKPKVQHPLWRWQHARLRSGSFGCFGGWPCEWLARTMKTPCFSWQKNTWPLPQRSTKKCGCGIRWIFFVGGVSAWML